MKTVRVVPREKTLAPTR